MSHAQSGILVAHSKFGLFIEAMVVGKLINYVKAANNLCNPLANYKNSILMRH